MTGRVLHLIPSLGMGGAERQLTYLSEGLVKRGWEVHVGHVAGGPHLAGLIAAGAAVHPLPAASNRDPRLLWHAHRLIRRVAPALVQTWIPMMDLIGGPLARLHRLPWILSERTNSAFEMHHRQVRVRARLGRFAAAVVANSESGRGYWEARVTNATRCLTIPNALPLSEIDAAAPAERASLGLPSGVPLVLSVSRLDKVKNFETLLDAAERIVAASDAHVLIGGEGAMQGYIAERVAGGALRGRVHAPGLISNPWSWMKAADVFVSVSRYEGMPNAVIEAMASGCPLVVSDIPQHREILADDSARFVPVESASAVANAILASLRDPAPQQRIAAAKRLTERFALDSVAARWEALYLELATAQALAAKPSMGEASKQP